MKLSLLRVLLFVVLVVFLRPALGQDGEEGEAAPVAEPAGEPAAAAEVGEEAEGAAEGAAPAQMTEEQQKQQQEVQKLYMEYLRRFLSDTCQMELQALQSFITATPETEDQPEKAEKIKAFESQCGEEMKKHEGEFSEKLRAGRTPKEILGPAKKRPQASRASRPSRTPKPVQWTLPTVTLTPELQIILTVVMIFVVPMMGLVLYCCIFSPAQPKRAAVAAPAAEKKAN